jgi:hypothetical protein
VSLTGRPNEEEERPSSAEERLVGRVGSSLSLAELWLPGTSAGSLLVELELRRLAFRYLLGLGGFSLSGGGPWARNSRLSCLKMFLRVF